MELLGSSPCDVLGRASDDDGVGGAGESRDPEGESEGSVWSPLRPESLVGMAKASSVLFVSSDTSDIRAGGAEL